MSNNIPENWFSTWFDSPYYHILYKNRNNEEAELFIDNITQYLNLPEEAKILDLACGKGRHSVYLNSLGYTVKGIDLSEQSIAYAKQFENETLSFETQDMRNECPEKYDAVFNLFTSFGYFENLDDNTKTLLAIKHSLNEYGFGVIDFFNADYVLENLVPHEVKTIDEIDFHITKRLDGKNIIKEIKFTDQGKDYAFAEKVTAFTLQDFEKMMEENDMYLLDIFGDYKLKKYYKTQSERLIMIFK